MSGSRGRWDCILPSILALVFLPILFIIARAALSAPAPTECSYIAKIGEALTFGRIPCMIFEWMAYFFLKTFGAALLLLATGSLLYIIKCPIQIIFWKEYKKYPRIYLNKITTDEESWFNRFEGAKKNKDNDCVIAAVSNVPVPGGYDLVLQPVAAGDTYKPNRGEDFDAFIRRDGSARKFRGRLGSVPLIGEKELSSAEAAAQFGQYMTEALEWFRNHPNC